MDQAMFKTEGVFVPRTLVVGDSDFLASRKVVLKAGNTLLAGAVLGRITASGCYTLSAAVADDGSQTPDLILAHDVEATVDTEVMTYARGDFNARALTLGEGHTLASITEGLRVKGITLLQTVV